MTRSKKEKISKSKIKSYHFLPRKYGKDLLLDIARIETLKNFVLDSTPHQISFYEILFIEDGKGSFSLDENKTALGPGTIIFTSPGQVRRWNARDVSGYTLFFEKDFLGLFFTDELENRPKESLASRSQTHGEILAFSTCEFDAWLRGHKRIQ